MTKVRVATTSFIAGELTTDLGGRSDKEIFRNGAERVRNFAPQAQGGVRSRPGLRYRATLPVLDVRLERFVFNATQRYVVAFSHERADIYLPDGTLATTLTGQAWTSAMIHSLSCPQFGDTMLVLHPDLPSKMLRRTSATSFTVEDLAYESFGTELHYPFNRYTAPENGLSIAFVSYPGGSTSWDIARGLVAGTVVDLETDLPIFDPDYVGLRLRVHSSQIEVTAVTDSTHAQGVIRSKRLSFKLIPNPLQTQKGSAAIVVSDPHHGFAPGDEVQLSGVEAFDNFGPTDINGARTVTAVDQNGWTISVGENADQSTDAGGGNVRYWARRMKTRDWMEPAFSAVRGWPRCGAFFNNRLVLGGCRSKPSGFWASKLGAYFNFDIGTALDTEAIWETVATDRLSEIRHIFSGRHLLILTDQSVVWVPTSEDKPLVPKGLQFREQAPFGAATVRPISFDGAALYLQSTGATVREALYSYNQNAFTSEPVSLRAPHLIRSPVSMAAQYGDVDQAEQYAFLVNTDGTLAVFHSVRSQEIGAWALWDTRGTFRQVCEAAGDIYFAVEREIDGAPVLMLEQLDRDMPPLDCAASASAGSPTRTFTGFGHLAGEEVEVVSSRRPLGKVTVASDGSIQLTEEMPEVTAVDVGFYSTAYLRPMPVDLDMPDGPARGLHKRLVRVQLVVDESLYATVDGDTLLLRFKGDAFDEEPTPRTGVIEFRALGISREAQVDVRVEQPARAEILSLTREVYIGG